MAPLKPGLLVCKSHLQHGGREAGDPADGAGLSCCAGGRAWGPGAVPGAGLALTPPPSHCRAAHGLPALLAENLFLQLGLTDAQEWVQSGHVMCSIALGGPRLCPPVPRGLFSNKSDSGRVPACGSVSTSQRLPWQFCLLSPGHHSCSSSHLPGMQPQQLPCHWAGSPHQVRGAASSWHSRLTQLSPAWAAIELTA